MQSVVGSVASLRVPESHFQDPVSRVPGPRVLGLRVPESRVSGFHNHFHNLLRLFDVLANIPFTTGEPMGDYYL